MSLLAPCPSCARHVRVTDTACPFCRSMLAADRTPSGSRTPLGHRARAMLTAAVATSALGCTTSTPTYADVAAIYGAPDWGLTQDAGQDAASDEADIDAGTHALYGAPSAPPAPPER